MRVDGLVLGVIESAALVDGDLVASTLASVKIAIRCLAPVHVTSVL